MVRVHHAVAHKYASAQKNLAPKTCSFGVFFVTLLMVLDVVLLWRSPNMFPSVYLHLSYIFIIFAH